MTSDALIVALLAIALVACRSEPRCISLQTLEIIQEYDNRDPEDDPEILPLCDED